MLISHLILPAIALGTIPLAIIARITRSSLLDVLGQDYVRTARAKGARERRVVLRHGLGNALLPVVTIIGLQLGGLLAGAVLTETIFRLGGVGTAIFEGIESRDYTIIQAFALIVAVGFLIVNLDRRPVVRETRPARSAQLMAATTEPLPEVLTDQLAVGRTSSLWKDTASQRPPPAQRGRRPDDPADHRPGGGLRRADRALRGA